MNPPDDPFAELREKKVPWPAELDLLDFDSEPTAKPLPLIDNLLDAGSRLIVGGSSKTYKTWLLCELALCIASGSPWMGFSTHRASVLYVNFEVARYHIKQRLRSIRQARKINLGRGQFFLWNVRNLAAFSLERFIEELCSKVIEHKVRFVVVDPFYKLLCARLNESSQTDMAEVLRKFDAINALDVSVAFALHFSKGLQGLKEPEDRISGAGALARDPDALITLTKNSDADQAFTIDFVIRDYPPVEHFAVLWNFPLLVKDSSLNPDNVKGKPGPVDAFPQKLFIELLKANPNLSPLAFRKLAVSQLGISRTGALHKLEALLARKVFLVSPLDGSVCFHPGFVP